MSCNKCLKDIYPGKIIKVEQGNCFSCGEPIPLRITKVIIKQKECNGYIKYIKKLSTGLFYGDGKEVFVDECY